MGVDITSKVIVGYTYDEICNWLNDRYEEDSEEYDEAKEDLFEGELDDLSPWFDSARYERLWGKDLSYGRYGPVELTGEYLLKAEQLIKELTEKFGIPPRIYAGAHVW